MWFECIRYRFRLRSKVSCLELAQIAALKSLRNSPRCRSWRVLPSPGDPDAIVLAIDWDPGSSATPFRGSAECSLLHAALGEQVRALEEADYRADTLLLRQNVGGTEALFRLSEDIVAGIMNDPFLSDRFESRDGSKRGRLGLWLLEVLGGPDLFSSSFPGAIPSDGPLADGLLDLDERERLLEIALTAVPRLAEDEGRSVLGALRAYLPLHPRPPSLDDDTVLLLPEGNSSGRGWSENDKPFPLLRSAPVASSEDDEDDVLSLETELALEDPVDAPASDRTSVTTSATITIGDMPASRQRQRTETEVQDPELELLPTGTDEADA
jgi:hypothetical protein